MTECKTWSLTADRAFTGLCSMRMFAEPSEVPEECEICVSPIEVAGGDPGTIISPECKSWQVLERLWNGQCTNTFRPMEGNPECEICVSPYAVSDPCSDCDVAPDEYTFTISGLVVVGGGPLGSVPLSIITAAQFQSYNVRRIGRCLWESEWFTVSTNTYAEQGPPPPPGTSPVSVHKAKKRLGISGGIGGSPLIVSGSVVFAMEEYPYRSGLWQFSPKLINRTPSQVTSHVCWPSLSTTQIPPTPKYLSALSVALNPTLTCEPVV